MLDPHPAVQEYKHYAMLRVDALNHALEGIPEDRVRYHICWGSWHGPHTTDIPLRDILDVMLRVRGFGLRMIPTVGHPLIAMRPQRKIILNPLFVHSFLNGDLDVSAKLRHRSWFNRCLPRAPIVDASPHGPAIIFSLGTATTNIKRDCFNEYQRKQQPCTLFWNFCPPIELTVGITNVSIGEFKWSPIRVPRPRLWTHKVACHGRRSRLAR
jgi:hypothetical protein